MRSLGRSPNLSIRNPRWLHMRRTQFAFPLETILRGSSIKVSNAEACQETRAEGVGRLGSHGRAKFHVIILYSVTPANFPYLAHLEMNMLDVILESISA